MGDLEGPEGGLVLLPQVVRLGARHRAHDDLSIVAQTIGYFAEDLLLASAIFVSTDDDEGALVGGTRSTRAHRALQEQFDLAAWFHDSGGVEVLVAVQSPISVQRTCLRRGNPRATPLWLADGGGTILSATTPPYPTPVNGLTSTPAALGLRARGRRLSDPAGPLPAVRHVLGARVSALAGAPARLVQRPVEAGDHLSWSERRVRAGDLARLRPDERGADHLRVPGVSG